MKTTSIANAIPLTQPGVGLRRRFYIGVTLLMGIVVVTGFWATYFGPLVRGTIAQPLLIHVHATVFAGWLALFLAQATLAATGHVSWHMKLGRWGIGYGILLIGVGLTTTVLRSAGQVIAGENGARLLYVGFFDMALFSIFFGAAIGRGGRLVAAISQITDIQRAQSEQQRIQRHHQRRGGDDYYSDQSHKTTDWWLITGGW